MSEKYRMIKIISNDCSFILERGPLLPASVFLSDIISLKNYINNKVIHLELENLCDLFFECLEARGFSPRAITKRNGCFYSVLHAHNVDQKQVGFGLFPRKDIDKETVLDLVSQATYKYIIMLNRNFTPLSFDSNIPPIELVSLDELIKTTTAMVYVHHLCNVPYDLSGRNTYSIDMINILDKELSLSTDSISLYQKAWRRMENK